MLSLTQVYRTLLRSIVVVGGERPEKTFHAGYVSANTEEKGYTDSITIGGIEVKDVWIRVSDNAFLNMNRDAGV